MSINSAQYIKDEANQNVTIKANFDGNIIIVPIDAEGNRHWIAIQAWVAEGNTIAEAD
jgi:hypothetical protein